MFRTFFNRRRAGADRLGARRQRGVTLIEVMIALVLTSILVLGLSGLWANVSRQFLFLTLKQKAVFVLNGEMERLSALYRFTDFADDDEVVDYPLAGDDGIPDTADDVDVVLHDNYCIGLDVNIAENPLLFTNPRFIYPDADEPAVPAIVDDIVITLDEITANPVDGPDVFVCEDHTCAGRVLYDLNGVGLGDDRNYVWIDQKRNITAEISWCLQPPRGVDPANSGSCSDGGDAGDFNSVPEFVAGGVADCQELTVFLEFPFRYTDVANPNSDMGKRETLTLITIVGRRP